MTALNITLLDAPVVEVSGKTASLVTRRNTALVAYLAVAGALETRDGVATLLWPELDAVRSRSYLRQALWPIKQALGAEWFAIDGDNVGQFPQGITFVPLASVAHPRLLATTILEAIGAPPAASSEPQHHLLHYLSEKQMLLVLKIVEHQLEGADLCVELLARAPGLKLLVTSRTLLDVRDEWLFPLQGLPVADEAPQLFEQCARRVKVDFSLLEENRPLVMHICQLVHGLPLAIELAAAWSRLLPLPAIVKEIEQSLDFLTASLRDLPERHRSLRAVFESSWRQLSTREQQCLRQLAVFHGGFQAEAAAVVADAALFALASLVDKSWLQVAPAGRYQMHELIGQFAAEKLAQTREDEQARDRHGHYFAQFLDKQTIALKGRAAKQAVPEVLVEIDNIRAAWTWVVERRRIEHINTLVEPLRLIAEARGEFHEIAGMYEAAIAWLRKDFVMPEADTTDLLKTKFTVVDLLVSQAILHWYDGQFLLMQQLCAEANTLLYDLPPGPEQQQKLAFVKEHLGLAYNRQGNYALAEQLNDEVITLYAELGNQHGYINALMGRAIDDVNRGRAPGAIEDFRRCLNLLTDSKDVVWIGAIRQRLGVAYWHQGDHVAAEQHLQQSLQLLQESGYEHHRAGTLMVLGNVAASRGRFEEAMQFYQKVIAYTDEGNVLPLKTNTLNQIAATELTWGKQMEAEAHYRESLAISDSIPYPHGRANALIGLGNVAAARNEYDQARRCYLDALATHSLPIQQIDVVIGFAHLLQQMRQPMRAMELFGLVQQHPATHYDTQCKAQQAIEQLSASLTAEQQAVALRWGQTQNLAAVITTIREEFA